MLPEPGVRRRFNCVSTSACESDRIHSEAIFISFREMTGKPRSPARTLGAFACNMCRQRAAAAPEQSANGPVAPSPISLLTSPAHGFMRVRLNRLLGVVRVGDARFLSLVALTAAAQVSLARKIGIGGLNSPREPPAV